MKKQTDFNFVKLNKEQSNELISIVQETVAKDFVSVKSFSVVDLWNIRRHGKTIWNKRKPSVL